MQGNEEKPVKGYSKEIEDGKSAIAMREESILGFWNKHSIFKKSLKKESPKGNYVFYDGPPFATGFPHYGHILGSTAKDVIGRYQTMRGFHVPRRWGWDCHGLPIENIVEKDLDISGKKAIEEFGVEKFTEYARSKVLTYVSEWKKTVDRIGRWVDFENSYKTMDNSFIESVWWALGQMNDKGLIYEGVRVLAYCPRCETPIANSEIAMDNSYKDITDISVYVKFELEDEPGTYLLAWTTTPWTLPGNTAIAVNKDIEYLKIMNTPDVTKGSDIIFKREYYLISKEIFDKKAEPVVRGKDEYYHFLGQSIKKTDEMVSGKNLVGKKYKPVFGYYKNTDLPNKENIYKVWHADFVTTEKGTGIAHEAPAFGEDDMELAKKHDIPFIRHVEPNGVFTKDVVDFPGLKAKPKDDHQSTDIAIIKHLAHAGFLFAKEKIIHSYPHCYRCETPLLYYALPSWFVNIQKVKKDLLESAESMNWIPSHLKDGRFRHSMENAPDWTFSRNRYWASPLPIWKSESGKTLFIQSQEELQKYTKKSGNTYFAMRHGQTGHNLKNRVSTTMNSGSHLTEEGQKKTAENAEALKGQGIDLIIASPFNRTMETAKIVAGVLGLSDEHVITDDRLHEMSLPMYEGRTWDEYHTDYPKTVENFDKAPEGNESYADVKRRMMSFMFEIEERYQNKKILIVTHGGPAWLLVAGVRMLDTDGTLELIRNSKDFHYFENSEIQPLPFIPFSHNAQYELDFHRPYIDRLALVDEKGVPYIRIPEVIDCWFESGSMPFAQDHYPFERPQWKEENFPAGFVAEYIAQTRTWFYYTHAISTILFGRAPFKNVVTTGTILAEDGQKMSKSKNNFPDPWMLFDKFGVDAIRFYLMSCPVMKGEDFNFSEKGVQDIASKIISRLDNVVAFYQLYRDQNLEKNACAVSPQNVLDQWIFARLYQLTDEVTKGMESYDMALATRPFDSFIEDLSTWYLRRSRERLKDGDKEAKQTLYVVLKAVAQLLAPFTPFIAEDIWQKLKLDSDLESVHLAPWPDAKDSNNEIIQQMENVRAIVTLGLEARQKAGIKVRQPLGSLKVKNLVLETEYLEILKDELNVKEIISDNSLEKEVNFDSHITEELRTEGHYRELIRAIQDMRKKQGLNPSDMVTLAIETGIEGQALLSMYKNDILKTVGATEIKIAENQGTEIKIDELTFIINIL
jgi:isoleucyl-tRNA synthetase